MRFNRYVEMRYLKDLEICFLINYLSGDVISLPMDEEVCMDALMQALDDDSIAYLKERGFLLEDDQADLTHDEIFLSYQKNKDVLHLILLPNENCNFRCTYCYENFNHYRYEEVMIAAIKKLLVKEIEKYQNLFLEYFGGEPLLESDTIVELNTYAKALCRQQHKKFFSHITTNGYLLDLENLKRLCASGVKTFTITIDGDQKTHDQTRVLANGKGTYANIMANLEAAHHSDVAFKMKIRCNVTSQNADGIHRLVSELHERFQGDARFRDVNIRSVKDYNQCVDDKSMLLNEQKAKQRVDALLNYAMSLHLYDLSLPVCFQLSGNVCYASDHFSYIIGGDGTIMKCSIDLRENEENIIGYLKDDGTMVIDTQKEKRWTHTKEEAICNDCIRYPSCLNLSCAKARNDGYHNVCPGVFKDFDFSLEQLYNQVNDEA